MTSTNLLRWLLTFLCCVAVASPVAGDSPGDPTPKQPEKQESASSQPTKPASKLPVSKPADQSQKDDAKTTGPKDKTAKTGQEPIVWSSDLAEACRSALADRKPIVVLIGAQWCAPCRKLAMEVHATAVQAELARWTPVYLDLNAQSADASRLAVVSVPAWRILAPGGQPVTQRDGYLATDEIVDWLKRNHAAATAAADDALLASGPPKATAVVRLIEQFRQRNPALREAAVRRLTPYPDVARSLVLKTFCEGSLTSRLAALEVLEQWKAPLADLDPWRPETFTPERVARLRDWGDGQPAQMAAASKTLSAEQLADARRQIDRMLTADASEADAIRHRLAGLGAALLPEVYARLKDAATDQQRRNLLILRYRLVASDSLVLRWPGGLERLADADPRQRRGAADELAKLAGNDEMNLLLELFADADPLVREIGLRGLQHIGGKEANAALVKLLDDPEPNVRAAVLKQLEESPDLSMAPAVIKYLKKEKDPDLVVHGICFLKEVKCKDSLQCLMSLLKHESWQVRAEAAVGIGKQNSDRHDSFTFGDPSSSSPREPDEALKLQVSAYVALLDLLNDKDAFVVAKAVEGLAHADMAVAVEPLVKAAETHPDLAGSVLKILANGNKMRDKAIPHLRRFCKHEQPRIRAAAITALASASPLTADEELLAAVNDTASEVRIAAAKTGFSLLNDARRAAKDKVRNSTNKVSPSVQIAGIEIAASDVVQNVASKVLEIFSTPAPPSTSYGITPAPAITPSKKAPSSGPPKESSGPASSPQEKIEVHFDFQTPPDGAGLQWRQRRPDEIAKPVKPDTVKPTPAAVKPTEVKAIEVKPVEVEPPKPSDGKKQADPKKAQEKADDLDAWLKECYAGRHRPKWSSQMVAPLQKMLHAESPEERIAAAMVLVPLGKADEAVPALVETVRAKPELVAETSDVLPWLCIEPRIKTFRDLLAIAPNANSRARLIAEFSREPDRRMVETMWDVLAAPNITINEGTSLHFGLLLAYLGQQYYSSTEVLPSDRRELAKAAKPRALSGSDIQRRIALMLLATANADEAAKVAALLAEDPKLDKDLRTDAFQVRLLTQSNAEAKKLALAAIKGDDADRKKPALKFLVHGPSELRSFGDGVYIHGMSITTYHNVQSGMPIVPEPPPGVVAKDVRPLLDSKDRETAASAGYLLALLGQPEGLEPLVQHWRQNEANSDQWRNLVYRAIAVVDDPKYIPVLREIYGKLDDYEVSEFYWTIRIMSGPEILKFRKQIRTEKSKHLR